MSIKLTSKSGGLAGSISVNATEVLTVTEDGNVGIGVANPVAPLHIESGESFVLTFDSDGTLSNSRPAWTTGAYGTTFKIRSTGTLTDIENNAVDRLTITANGNVGIGTSTPGFKLTIQGVDPYILVGDGIEYSGVEVRGPDYCELIVNTGADVDYGGALEFKKSRGTHETKTACQSDDYPMVIRAGAYDGSAYRYISGILSFVEGTVSSGNVSGNLQFWTRQGTSGYTERMRITANGQVGIGTSSPKGKLHIAGGDDTYNTAPATLFLDSGRTDNGAGYGIIQGERAVKTNKPQFIMSHWDPGSSLELYIGGGNWAAGPETNVLYFCTTPDYGTTASTVAPVKFSIDGNANFRRTIPEGSTLYPDFCARAWVNFNGTGTVAIRGSGNVSSITDNNVGNYTINMTTAMPDTNYNMTVTIGQGAVNSRVASSVAPSNTPTTTAFEIRTHLGNNNDGAGGYTATDYAYVSVSVFR